MTLSSSCSGEHGVLTTDGSRRNPFAYHIPSPTNCSLYHNGNSVPNSQSSPLTQCVWTFFWLAVLIAVAYPMGLLSGQLYILLSPLSAVFTCKPLAVILELLLQGLHMPLVCTNNMAVAKPLFII